MLEIIIPLIIFIISFIIIPGLRIVMQYEKGIIFTFGRYTSTKEPGLRWFVPVIQSIRK